MRHFARVALVVACAAWGASAKAAVVDIITVSNFHSTASGFLQSYIENVSGYFTTTPGQLSNLTVTEYAGQTYTYHFTTPYLGSAWTAANPDRLRPTPPRPPPRSTLAFMPVPAPSGTMSRSPSRRAFSTWAEARSRSPRASPRSHLPRRRPARASQGSPSCLSRDGGTGAGTAVATRRGVIAVAPSCPEAHHCL